MEDKVTQIAVIPKHPMIENSVKLSRLNTNKISGHMKGFSGIRLEWDWMIGAIDYTTHEMKNAKFDLMVYGKGSILSTEITEENLVEMLDYVRKVKSQIGKKIDYEHSFQGEKSNDE